MRGNYVKPWPENIRRPIPGFDEAKERLRTLWMQRAELEQQLDLECDLRHILSAESLLWQTRNFCVIFEDQIQELTDKSRVPFLSQIESLARMAQELEGACGTGRKALEAAKSVQREIDQLRMENERLSSEIEDLLSQVSGSDDDEMHLSRAEGQPIELTRRKLAFAHP
jgi:hypothetical protein